MTALEILKAARAKITLPGTWTQGVCARNAEGTPVNVTDPTACQWCLFGAIWAAAEGDPSAHPVWFRVHADKTEKALRVFLPLKFKDVPNFNDDPTTTHADILALFDRAIAAQEVTK